MTDSFVWDRNVLRGPFHLLIEEKVDLPRGPPESAPLDSGEWSIGIETRNLGWALRVWWSAESTRAGDVRVVWTAVNHSEPCEPEPIHGSLKVGARLQHPMHTTSTNKDVYLWNIDEHVLAGSAFEMTVECPSLRAPTPEPGAEPSESSISTYLKRESGQQTAARVQSELNFHALHRLDLLARPVRRPVCL